MARWGRGFAKSPIMGNGQGGREGGRKRWLERERERVGGWEGGRGEVGGRREERGRERERTRTILPAKSCCLRQPVSNLFRGAI